MEKLAKISLILPELKIILYISCSGIIRGVLMQLYLNLH